MAGKKCGEWIKRQHHRGISHLHWRGAFVHPPVHPFTLVKCSLTECQLFDRLSARHYRQKCEYEKHKGAPSGEVDLTGTLQKLEDGVKKINWYLVPKAFKCKVKKFRLHPRPTGKHYLFLSWRTSRIKKINQDPTWPPLPKEDPFSIISDLIELWGAQRLGRNSKVIFSFLRRVYCLSKDLDSFKTLKDTFRNAPFLSWLTLILQPERS